MQDNKHLLSQDRTVKVVVTQILSGRHQSFVAGKIMGRLKGFRGEGVKWLSCIEILWGSGK